MLGTPVTGRRLLLQQRCDKAVGDIGSKANPLEIAQAWPDAVVATSWRYCWPTVRIVSGSSTHRAEPGSYSAPPGRQPGVLNSGVVVRRRHCPVRRQCHRDGDTSDSRCADHSDNEGAHVNLGSES